MTQATFKSDFDGLWLPRAPLAGSKTSHRRMSRQHALQESYIESNPLVLRSLMVIDHDGGNAEHIADLTGLPAPSYTAINRHTRDGHLVYALKAPVCLTDAAHRRPINLLARVESGLNTVLGGDVAYGGRITKNPMHEDHVTVWGEQSAVYGLTELAKALGGLGALPRWDERSTLRNSGVGRNVALFDTTRAWSYRARGAYKDPVEWEEVVHAYAWNKNMGAIADQFTAGPLGDLEVKHLARSVARWTWRNIKRTFEEEQARRGNKGGVASGIRRRGGLTREELAELAMQVSM